MRLIASLILLASLTVSAMGQSLSALTAEAMDKQLPQEKIELADKTLPEAIKFFEDLTAVRIQAAPETYEMLPWGELTTFSAKLEHQTLRQALDAITQKLGLQYKLNDDGLVLSPLPPLHRLGRRCTVDELAQIDLLQSTLLDLPERTTTVSQLLTAIDDKLLAIKSPYDVENRIFKGDAGKVEINVPRNATLYTALQEITRQTNGTWYPWGKSLVVLSKVDKVRSQLSRRITIRFDGDDVSKVLEMLAERSGVEFEIEPGAVQKIAPQFRQIRLTMDNATITQGLETIAGFTGLGYQAQDSGVYIWNSGPATGTVAGAMPSTQPTR